jgi:hypothetical protein
MWCVVAGVGLLVVAPAILAAQAQAATEETAEAEFEEVVVYGTDGEVIAGIYAESELGAEGIAAYGANTVADLLGQVAPDVDNSEEGPVILINGKPAVGIRSVNDLPPEAVKSIQVLPPQAAAAIGQNPTRRVINVVLKNEFHQGLANLTTRKATAGEGFGANGNANMVQVNGNSFRNLALFASTTDPLLEADRHIISQPAVPPFDLTGNVVSWPLAGTQIDPALSAMAGQPVTVLGIPSGVSRPTFGDFLPRANLANTSDMGRYRTLVPDQYNYGVNAGWSRPLPRNTALNFNLNATRARSLSLTGAPFAVLRLPASSPFTPFSRDVGIARYLGEPLEQESNPTTVNLGGNLSTQLGKWRLQVESSFNWNSSTTLSDRGIDVTALQAAVDAGTLNPFDPLPTELLDSINRDRARSRNYSGLVAMQLMGAPFELPTGKANASLRVEWRDNRQKSTTVGMSTLISDRERQDELAQASLQVPLWGDAKSRDGGKLGSELSAAARHVTATGTQYDYGYGLNWRQGTRLTLRVGFNRQRVAPQPDALTRPLITVDGYRAYDFIRQETVLVRYITGGNPDLKVENRDATSIRGTFKPFEKVDFALNAEYQRTVGHDTQSGLPPVSADVQAAFPDRYLRDASGRLIQIDARPVSFARSESEQLRWGANFRRSFGATPPKSGAQRGIVITDGTDLSGAGWRVMANFTHTWLISNTRLARPGLPEVDLLSGGAVGYSGQSRHSIQSRLGGAHNGSGLQFNVNWKSRSHLTAGTADAPNDIVFKPLLRIEMSMFADMGTVLPGNRMARGLRISLGADNLLAARQHVVDDTGTTPLRYQPYLLNPQGRVVSLSLRKAFQ